MSRMIPSIAIAIAIAVAVGVGIPGCSDTSDEPDPQPLLERALGPRATASCGEAALGGLRAGWRAFTTDTGPFGLSFPEGGSFRSSGQLVRTRNGWSAKMAASVEGTTPVTVAVPKDLTRRVGLVYGTLHAPRRVSDGRSKVAFVPCEGRRGTGWPGGMFLKGRSPIRLDVQVEGQTRVRTLRLG